MTYIIFSIMLGLNTYNLYDTFTQKEPLKPSEIKLGDCVEIEENDARIVFQGPDNIYISGHEEGVVEFIPNREIESYNLFPTDCSEKLQKLAFLDKDPLFEDVDPLK